MPLIWRLRLWMLRREYVKACRQSSRVLAVSNYAKGEVCRRFNLHQEMVDVVYHGIDSVEIATTRKPDFDIPEDFIFSAGSIVPYRGYEDIIRSLAQLRSNGGKAPCVILAGSGAYHPTSYERFLRRLAKSLRVEDIIIWAGQLQSEEMAWCFHNAKLFIQTSRAEACPNIVLEAMGHGCVAISCDHPPMPEFFVDTAFYYPTGDAGALAVKIQRVLEMGQDEIRMVQVRAQNRASFFTWEKTAAQTMEVLERAIGSA